MRHSTGSAYRKTYKAFNDSYGILLKVPLPKSMVQEVVDFLNFDKENHRVWVKGANFLTHTLFNLPLSQHYVTLGYRDIHISQFSGYLRTTLTQTTSPAQMRRKPSGNKITQGAKNALVLLLWLMKHDRLYDFFDMMKSTFALQSRTEISFQALQNLMMIAWEDTQYTHAVDTTLPWEWQNTIFMDTFFENIQKVDPAECVQPQ